MSDEKDKKLAQEPEQAAAEEQPRRRRTRAKKDEGAEAEPKTGSEEKAEKQEDEAAIGSEEETPSEPAKPDTPPRRRGAAETTVTQSKPARSRDGDGAVVVRAQARYVRTAPRKARLVVDHIRGKSVAEARAILAHTPRAASRDVLKLLNSAVANAENNHELLADELKVAKVYVDEGPTLKRYQPRALGRATRIRKRTSHMTIHLTPTES
jgi:ribosomal protein L22